MPIPEQPCNGEASSSSLTQVPVSATSTALEETKTETVESVTQQISMIDSHLAYQNRQIENLSKSGDSRLNKLISSFKSSKLNWMEKKSEAEERLSALLSPSTAPDKSSSAPTD